MKVKYRLCAMIGITALLMMLCACGGDVSNVEQKFAGSEIYSQKDIDSAAVVVKKYFKSNFKGCTLTDIVYPGDDEEQFNALADEYDADQGVILVSSFDTGESGGDGSLNKNSTYDGWQWMLVRSDGGKWRHVDHGY